MANKNELLLAIYIAATNCCIIRNYYATHPDLMDDDGTELGVAPTVIRRREPRNEARHRLLVAAGKPSGSSHQAQNNHTTQRMRPTISGHFALPENGQRAPEYRCSDDAVGTNRAELGRAESLGNRNTQDDRRGCLPWGFTNPKVDFSPTHQSSATRDSYSSRSVGTPPARTDQAAAAWAACSIRARRAAHSSGVWSSILGSPG